MKGERALMIAMVVGSEGGLVCILGDSTIVFQTSKYKEQVHLLKVASISNIFYLFDFFFTFRSSSFDLSFA
jgi:hypothetical protein